MIADHKLQNFATGQADADPNQTVYHDLRTTLFTDFVTAYFAQMATGSELGVYYSCYADFSFGPPPFLFNFQGVLISPTTNADLLITSYAARNQFGYGSARDALQTAAAYADAGVVLFTAGFAQEELLYAWDDLGFHPSTGSYDYAVLLTAAAQLHAATIPVYVAGIPTTIGFIASDPVPPATGVHNDANIMENGHTVENASQWSGDAAGPNGWNGGWYATPSGHFTLTGHRGIIGDVVEAIATDIDHVLYQPASLDPFVAGLASTCAQSQRPRPFLYGTIVG
jgi:hypothetical protein